MEDVTKLPCGEDAAPEEESVGGGENGGKDKTLQILVFATAILNLVKSLIDLIERLTK